MPFSYRQRWVRSILLSLLLALALTGCGGGGPAATGPPPQWGLGSINADVAYDNIELLKGQAAEPGAGVTIGFIDSGIDQDHPAFAGKTVTEEHLEETPDETGTGRFSHGTAVASVATGRYGVAWGADIAMFAITLGRGGGNYVPISLGGLAGRNADWAKRVSDVLAWRDGSRAVDILNVSIAVNGIIDSYSEQQLRANFGDAIAAMAQTGTTEKTIFVWGAGNAHNDPCDPARFVAVREREGQCGLGGGVGGSGGADRRAPGSYARGGGVAARVRFSSPRASPASPTVAGIARRILHRGARTGGPDRLFRTRFWQRGPGLPVRQRNLLFRPHGRRRAGALEAALSRPAREHGAGGTDARNRRQQRTVRQPGDLRTGQDGSGRGNLRR